MPSLRELQAGFRAALLVDDEHAVADAIVADDLAVSARLAIYRHHVLTSLTAALETTYPVVCQLVDRRFFGWLADRFIRAHPPDGPCLAEYGAALPAFIDGFPACANLPWLGDVARLEWALNTALHAPDAPTLTAEQLAAIAPAALPTLALMLEPSLRLLASRWPVDAIWRAHQPGAAAMGEFEADRVELEIRRVGDDVVFRRLSRAAFALREVLATGRRLGAAVEAALAADPACDIAGEIRALLDDRVCQARLAA